MDKYEKAICELMEQREFCCQEIEKDSYTLAIECIERVVELENVLSKIGKVYLVTEDAVTLPFGMGYKSKDEA